MNLCKSTKTMRGAALVIGVGYSLSLLGCGGANSPHRAYQEAIVKLDGRFETNDDNKVVFVNLSDTDADNDTLKLLGQIETLEKLWLANTNVTDEGLAALSELKQLRVLVLSDTYVSNVGLRELSSLTSLEELYLLGARVNQNGADELQEHIPELSILY